jgi:hypothetical protein
MAHGFAVGPDRLRILCTEWASDELFDGDRKPGNPTPHLLFDRGLEAHQAFVVARGIDIGRAGTIDGIGFSSASKTAIESISPHIWQSEISRRMGSIWRRAHEAADGGTTGNRENAVPGTDESVVCSGLTLPSHRARASHLVLCNSKRLCYTQPACERLFRLFPDSSAVEHSTVNRMVAGSNPAPGAIRCFPLNWLSSRTPRNLSALGALLHRWSDLGHPKEVSLIAPAGASRSRTALRPRRVRAAAPAKGPSF